MTRSTPLARSCHRPIPPTPAPLATGARRAAQRLAQARPRPVGRPLRQAHRHRPRRGAERVADGAQPRGQGGRVHLRLATRRPPLARARRAREARPPTRTRTRTCRRRRCSPPAPSSAPRRRLVRAVADPDAALYLRKTFAAALCSMAALPEARRPCPRSRGGPPAEDSHLAPSPRPLPRRRSLSSQQRAPSGRSTPRRPPRRRSGGRRRVPPHRRQAPQAHAATRPSRLRAGGGCAWEARGGDRSEARPPAPARGRAHPSLLTAAARELGRPPTWSRKCPGSV